MSATIIVLQIALTRILSVIVWYHWAFFSVSLAMLGVGAPGVWFALKRPSSPRLLQGLLLGAAVSLPAAVIALIRARALFQDGAVLFCLAVMLPPVLLLGAAVCWLLLEAKGPSIGRMYAFDLLGAFCGALLVIPLMWLVPTPLLAAGLSVLPLIGFFLVGGGRLPGLVVAAALLGLLAWQEPFVLHHGKSYAETTARTRPILERWTPTARITVFDSVFFTEGDGGFGWGMGTVAADVKAPQQYWIEQDGSAGTPITRFDGDSSKLGYLAHDVTSVGYQLRRPDRAAVVGAGGGRDVLTALTLGARHVTAIELNAAIVEIMRTELGEFCGGLYDRPDVTTVIGEGRSVLTHADEKFDLIQISLIDSWAATSAGAYTLSENNLYTVEAYRLYWSKLTSDGLVSTSRWMIGGFGLETPRLLYVIKQALIDEGVKEPLKHIAMLQGGAVGTVLMLRSPITVDEARKLQRIAEDKGFTLHLPETSLPQGERWVRAIFDAGPDSYLDRGLRMEPTYDDRPFFFQVVSPLRRIAPEVAEAYGFNSQGVLTLQQLMIAMAGLTLLLFFVPFVAGRWLEPETGFWRGSLYFTLIGLAFMLVEVAWLQRFILYLGHPSLATTVALGCMLLGAGVGSMYSMRVGLRRAQRLGFVVPLVILAVNLLLSPVFELTLGWPWALRLLNSALLITPAGFVMGFCFPLGMVRFGEGNRAWFWALNGAASVLASALTLALSMELGFTRVALVGVGLYAVVWLLLRGGPQDAPAPGP